jgi:RimJ/RimL family protein N-acetyltransferase
MAITDRRNTPSLAVLERLRFKRDSAPRGRVIFKGEPCDEYLYGIWRENWLARTSA